MYAIVNTFHDYTAVSDSSGIMKSDSKTLFGNKSLFVSLGSFSGTNSYFTFSNSSLFHTGGSVTPTVGPGHYYAAKAYVKIVKDLTSDSGQYGGNTNTVLVNQRWISTGASLFGNEVVSTEMILDVFGGDTYLNMFSLNKFHIENYNADSKHRIAQGLIFPVESSVNIDMRRGTYFGKNLANIQVEDEYIYSPTYSASNNLKSFPAKDLSINLIQNYNNLIAASNIKIAGQIEDAFSRFDANENFEVNGNYGEIKNLISFRDNLYAIQERGVSILSINTRALINTENGSAISIQSALGTGTVIERNDYISTKYGSQNRLNAISTDLGLYWIDNNNASICAIQAKQPNFVINLSEAKSCTNIVSFKVC